MGEGGGGEDNGTVNKWILSRAGSTLLPLCRKEKRAIEEFERKSGGEGRGRGVGTLKSWINLKIETDKNHQVYKTMFSNIILHFHGLQFYICDVYFFREYGKSNPGNEC